MPSILPSKCTRTSCFVCFTSVRWWYSEEIIQFLSATLTKILFNANGPEQWFHFEFRVRRKKGGRRAPKKAMQFSNLRHGSQIEHNQICDTHKVSRNLENNLKSMHSIARCEFVKLNWATENSTEFLREWWMQWRNTIWNKQLNEQILPEKIKLLKIFCFW